MDVKKLASFCRGMHVCYRTQDSPDGVAATVRNVRKQGEVIVATLTTLSGETVDAVYAPSERTPGTWGFWDVARVGRTDA